MIKHIYKIKERIYSEQPSETNQSPEYTLKEIKPTYVCGVYYTLPTPVTIPIINEEGEVVGVTTETPDFNISVFYPDFDNELMLYSDTKFSNPKLQGDTLVEMTREEICQSGDLSILIDGEIYQDNKITYKAPPEDMVKPKWVYPDWIEQATEDEITKYVGNLVTKLLYEALAIGCEVTVKGEKHQQTLENEKRRALNEKISGIDLKIASGKEVTVVPWPFKDDGSDTVVMSVDDFRTMALYCFDYGDNCYVAAELLKAKRKIDSTLDDFYAELDNVGSISLKNL